jgi:putative redox protein
MTGTVCVKHLAGDRFEVSVRQHRLEVDQPIDDGGEDSAPTPTELFVASLASCVGFYARRFLHRHGLPTEGLAVEAHYEMGSRPARVSAITLVVRVPEGVPDERRDALLAVASHCTVHNTLADPPNVRIDLTLSAHRAA